MIDIHALEKTIKDSGVSFHENSISWIFTCPRCSKQNKLYIRKRDGRFCCWVCATATGYQGRPEYALHDILGLPLAELRSRFYGAGYQATEGPYIHVPEFSDFFSDDDIVPEEIMPPRQAVFPLEFVAIDHPHAAKAQLYLAKRGISIDLAKEYGIYYNPVERRVVFPIEVDGTTIGWQARTILPSSWWDEEAQVMRKTPKVLTSPGVDREHRLMFQDRLKGSRHAILCEGPVDAIKCHLAGGNVASMGKSVSEGQLQAIQASGVRRLYLALDPDAASEITRLCRKMADIDVYQMTVPEGHMSPVDYTDMSAGTKPAKDFGDMSIEEVYMSFLEASRVNAGQVFAPATAGFFSRR